MIKLLLLVAPVLLVALSALPGVLIRRGARRRNADAIADFRDTLAPVADLDPEQATLDAKWARYWAESDDDWLRSDLRVRLLNNDEAVDEIVVAFEHDCERIVKNFITDALATCRAHANHAGRLWALGFTNDVEREADRWYTMAKVNHTTVAHLVEQEITDTRWTDRDTAALRAYMAEQEQRARAPR
jgi:hypothetical protein